MYIEIEVWGVLGAPVYQGSWGNVNQLVVLWKTDELLPVPLHEDDDSCLQMHMTFRLDQIVLRKCLQLHMPNI